MDTGTISLIITLLVASAAIIDKVFAYRSNKKNQEQVKESTSFDQYKELMKEEKERRKELENRLDKIVTVQGQYAKTQTSNSARIEDIEQKLIEQTITDLRLKGAQEDVDYNRSLR